MSECVDLTGQTFSRLYVVRKTPIRRYGSVMWRCLCVCGSMPLVSSSTLRSGVTRSCGCLQRDIAAQIGANTARHGFARKGKVTRTWRIWWSMRQRCENPNDWSYKLYGARGIRVCRRWVRFETFLADMGEAPKGLTLDRRNNNGPYSPKNCRWVTWSVQNKNRRPFGSANYRRTA